MAAVWPSTAPTLLRVWARWSHHLPSEGHQQLHLIFKVRARFFHWSLTMRSGWFDCLPFLFIESWNRERRSVFCLLPSGDAVKLRQKAISRGLAHVLGRQIRAVDVPRDARHHVLDFAKVFFLIVFNDLVIFVCGKHRPPAALVPPSLSIFWLWPLLILHLRIRGESGSMKTFRWGQSLFEGRGLFPDVTFRLTHHNKTAADDRLADRWLYLADWPASIFS